MTCKISVFTVTEFIDVFRFMISTSDVIALSKDVDEVAPSDRGEK